MSVKILFDPFKLVVDSFESLYPGIDCELSWVEKRDRDTFGTTFFPDDKTQPVVSVWTGTPIAGAIEILAHELAHVAAGPVAEHGAEWEKAFNAIFEKYCEFVAEIKS